MYALEFRVLVPRGVIPTQPQPRSSPANPEGEFQMTKVRLLMLILPLVALAAASGCRSAHTTSAILYIDEQNYQKAVDVIDEGLSYDPNDAEAYFWQGEAYSHMAEKASNENDYVKAKESYGPSVREVHDGQAHGPGGSHGPDQRVARDQLPEPQDDGRSDGAGPELRTGRGFLSPRLRGVSRLRHAAARHRQPEDVHGLRRTGGLGEGADGRGAPVPRRVHRACPAGLQGARRTRLMS